MSSSRRAPAGGVERGRRAAVPGLLLVLALIVLAAAPLAAASQPLAGGDGLVWITLGEELYVRAAARLAPPPGLDRGVVLERLDAHDGVVLTRIPLAALEELSRVAHEELGVCGGFIKHETVEEAAAAMARLRAPREAPAALPFTIDQPALVAALAGQVDEASLLGTMTSLSTLFVNRYHLHPVGTQAANWIKDQWTAYAAGRPDVTVELFSHPGITPQPSVVLTIPGSTLPDQYVILGAHEDSTRFGCSISSNPACDAPGADDDGSGVAVLSEVIRIAMAEGFQPQRTVQLMAYAAEEVGLDGSDHIASVYQSQGRNVVAVLQQDMTAYHGSAQDLFVYNDSYTDPELNAFFADLVATYQPGMTVGTSSCGYGCSDHYSWAARGYRAALVFEAAFNQSNPYIHSSSDTTSVPNFSAAHAAKFARMAVAFMVEAAVDGVVPGIFSDGFETGDTSRWSWAAP